MTTTAVPDRLDARAAPRDVEEAAPRPFVTLVAAGLSLFALAWVFEPLPAPRYQMCFLAVVLPLTLVAYPAGGRRSRRGRANPSAWDWALAGVALLACAYPLTVFDAFVRRTVEPTALDVGMGVVVTLLVLEAARRTVGWMLPAVCAMFLVYAFAGGLIPIGWLIGHPGYDVERLVSTLFMGSEGLYGVPLGVTATYILLFTIYGAVLDLSGASRFFIDTSFAAFRRSRAAAGRTVTLAGLLLGAVSGSGVATTVSLGPVAWPILERAGYPKEQAGGVIAASGIGALLSPPTLGAATFIVAELLDATYLRVLLLATIPTLLYYLGVILSVEIDARRFGVAAARVDTPPLGALLLRFGYHFSSLLVIVVFLTLGMSPFRAVAYATGLAFALSFLDPARRLTPRRALQALAQGAMGVLPIAASAAAAGIIVGVVTLTGLSLRASSIIVDLAGGNLALTALASAAAVLVIGLAVPVTASFIVAATIVAPAMQSLGVGADAVLMFVLYYAVLSEVSPPTALSAVAAAAITGGDALGTMLMTWRYTLPAFLVPFAVVLTPAGEALLGQAPFGQIALATAISMLSVAALAILTGGWLLGPAGPLERALAGGAAVALLFLQPVPVLIGLGLLALAFAIHLARRKRGLARLVTALLTALALAACGSGASARRLSIATGSTTGVYYLIGGGLADVVTRGLDGYQATVEATAGSVENIERVARGDSDIGFAAVDAAADAVAGHAPFDQPRPIRALLRLYPDAMQVAVRADAGIDSVAGMRGKRVSVGPPNSGVEVVAMRLLRAACLDPDRDIDRQQLSLGDGVQAMKDGLIDALFWSGGVPTVGITDLTSSLGDQVRLLDLDELLPALRREYGPVYQPALIPAAAYGLPAGVQTIAAPNLLIVNASLSDDLAYDLVRLIFDHQADLNRVHPEARNIRPDLASQTGPVPLHPGAARYFADRAT
ncbi:MAG: TRAP transporter fused permease subunit [Egibacteraceae bacterium]